METNCNAPKEEKLFGYPKWDVENLADSIQRTEEKRTADPGLYGASVKLLQRRQHVLGAVLKSASSKRGRNDGE